MVPNVNQWSARRANDELLDHLMDDNSSRRPSLYRQDDTFLRERAASSTYRRSPMRQAEQNERSAVQRTQAASSADSERTTTTVGSLTQSHFQRLAQVNDLLKERTRNPIPLTADEERTVTTLRNSCGIVIAKSRLTTEQRAAIYEDPYSAEARNAEEEALRLQTSHEAGNLSRPESPQRKSLVRTAAVATAAILAFQYGQSVRDAGEFIAPTNATKVIFGVTSLITVGGLVNEETTDKVIQVVQDFAIAAKNHVVRNRKFYGIVAAIGTAVGTVYTAYKAYQLTGKFNLEFEGRATVLDMTKAAAEGMLDSTIASFRPQVILPSTELSRAEVGIKGEFQGTILPAIAECAIRIAEVSSTVLQYSVETLRDISPEATALYQLFNE